MLRNVIGFIVAILFFVNLGCGSNDSSGNTTGGSTSPATSTCPSNYVLIQANSSFATSDFCIAKYEMKVAQNDGTPVFDGFNGGVALDVSLYKPDSRPNGIPWVKILQADAVAECVSLGTGYHLVTAKEWQVVARDIESVSANWNGVQMYKGHTDGGISATAVADGYAVSGSLLLSAGDGTDPYVGTGQDSSLAFGSGKEQSRVFVLSSAEVIWDMSGNARDLVDIDGQGGTLSYTGPASSNFYEVTSSEFSTMLSTATSSNAVALDSSWFLPTNLTWNHATNFIGKVYMNTGAQSLRVVARGGNFSSGNSPGLYAADFDQADSGVSSSASFRCVAPVN